MTLHDLACAGDPCNCERVWIAKPSPRLKRPLKLVGRPHRISPSLKDKVLERDNFTCQWCKVPGGALDAHHRLSRAQGGTDRLDNLVSAHRQCHRTLHANPLWARTLGFIVGRNKT